MPSLTQACSKGELNRTVVCSMHFPLSVLAQCLVTVQPASRLAPAACALALPLVDAPAMEAAPALAAAAPALAEPEASCIALRLQAAPVAELSQASSAGSAAASSSSPHARPWSSAAEEEITTGSARSSRASPDGGVRGRIAGGAPDARGLRWVR
mmetsp:Transcript_87193/g.275356  ORF Transcript_87193/g.275356 Transcript_87193/m.275356 type:complete len:155 (+) Transcript_87193:218-682(+)